MFLCEDEGIELAPIPATGATQEVVSRTLNENFARLAAEVAKVAKRGSDVSMEEVNRQLAMLKDEQRAMAESIAVRPAYGGGSGGDEFRRFLDAAGKPVLRNKDGLDPSGGERTTMGLFDDDAHPINDWHAEARQLVTTRTIAMLTLGRPTPKIDAKLARHMAQAPECFGRTFSGASGLGSEWVQLAVAPTIYDQLRLPVLPVEDLFEQIPMSTGSLVLPVQLTMPRAYRYGQPGTEPTNYKGSDVQTSGRTLNAQGLAVMTPIWDDAAEDSIAAAGTAIANAVTSGLRYSFVDAVINGDTTSPHQDTALASWNPASIFDTNATFGGSDDPRRAFLGLRADAYDTGATRDGSGDSTFSGAGGTLVTAEAALKSPHGALGDLILLTSWQYYIAKIATDANLLTVDKYGPNATILTGEVGTLYGRIKVVLCELVTADLATTGLYTGTGSYTGALLFNRKRWIRGVRRVGSTEMERVARHGVNYLVATRRDAFKKIDATADKTVHWTYKL
jgi:hypothetical protein